jgi:hypothetical protein
VARKDRFSFQAERFGTLKECRGLHNHGSKLLGIMEAVVPAAAATAAVVPASAETVAASFVP